MMLTWRGDAGYHAAHEMEGAGATGEDTIRKRTGRRERRGWGGTHKNKWELKGGARITK